MLSTGYAASEAGLTVLWVSFFAFPVFLLLIVRLDPSHVLLYLLISKSVAEPDVPAQGHI